MKKKIIYIFGFLLSLAVCFISCSKEDPAYSNIIADRESIDVIQDSEMTFSLIDGNGNYHLSIADENIATASAIGNQITIKGISYGSTTITITDWANKSLTLPVKVNHNQVVDLVLAIKSTQIYLGESKEVKIFSGNEGYKVTSSNPEIVQASIKEDVVVLNGKTLGNVTITVTDKEQKSTELAVSVINKLIIDRDTEISYLTVGEPLTINILNGNGEYTCETDASSSYLKYEMATDKTSITINGLKRTRLNKTVTIKDKAGQSAKTTIVYIDDPYMENPTYRYLILGSSSYQSLSTSKVGQITYSPEFNLSQLIIKSGTTSTASGFAVQFTGDLSVGAKSNAVLYKVTKNAVDKSTQYPAEDCKIDKVEDGWYWISFKEPNCTVRSYFITKQ